MIDDMVARTQPRPRTARDEQRGNGIMQMRRATQSRENSSGVRRFHEFTILSALSGMASVYMSACLPIRAETFLHARVSLHK